MQPRGDRTGPIGAGRGRVAASVLGTEQPRAGRCSEFPSLKTKNSVPPALGPRDQLPSLKQMLGIARVAVGASEAEQMKCSLFPQLPRLAP